MSKSKMDELQEKIRQVELRRSMAEGEATAWNKGKLSHSSNAKLSRILAQSLEKELEDLYKQLRELKD